MQFTKTTQEVILNSIRQTPLKESEYRRIEGLGQMYLALEDTPEDRSFTTVAVLRLDGVMHRLCRLTKNGDVYQ